MWIDVRLKDFNTFKSIATREFTDFTVIFWHVFDSVPVKAHVQGGVWLVWPNLTYKRVSIFHQNKRMANRLNINR